MIALLLDSSAWAALLTLTALEIVLGIDNLVVIAHLTGWLDAGAYGFDFHIPRGYIYFALAFSAGVEAANVIARKRRRARKPPSGSA